MEQRREVDGWLVAAVSLGGVLGAEARYGLGELIPHRPHEFPWATLLINTLGCLLIGVLMVVITEVVRPHRLVRPFLGVGILGGFTTFSTASVDAVVLADAHRPGAAAAYVLLTLLGALAAVWIAVGTTGRVAGRMVPGGPA